MPVRPPCHVLAVHNLAALFVPSGAPALLQSWCFDVSAAADNSSCSRRLAAYWTYLPAGRVVNISWAAGTITNLSWIQ